MPTKSVKKPSNSGVKQTTDAENKKKKKKADGWRETIESIAIAFVLAFMFKTFQAEAYVIPTGSMGPTLFGRHKDVTCKACGFNFAVGASSEIDQESGELIARIGKVLCSNCGHSNDAMQAPVFNGDRIIVNKQISRFERFDVVVFKNPEQPRINYIKRLIGLPGETIRIRKGDIWAKMPGQAEWEIQRKENPFVQKSIQLTVYDDAFPAQELLEFWPERWEPSEFGEGSPTTGGWLPVKNAWKPDREARVYDFDVEGKEPQWLRYRHFLPTPYAWLTLLNPDREQPPIQTELIKDLCSFNAFKEFDHRQKASYWVSDLTINATVTLDEVNADSQLLFELVEGPDTWQCVINASTGQATLQSLNSQTRDLNETIAVGKTGITAADTYEISFANVDDRLCLWVDHELISFDGAFEYKSSDLAEPTDRDLAPVGIAVSNAKGSVTDLLLQRDIYYQNDLIEFDEADGVSVFNPWGRSHNDSDYNSFPHDEGRGLSSFLSNPAAWARNYAEQTEKRLASFEKYCEYQLADDEYLMLGDNSAMSKDGRLFDYETRPMNGVFSHRYAVREADMIGKALFIFWPHGVPFLNDGKGFPVWHHNGRGLEAGKYPSVRVPFYPNVGRMKKIR